MDVRICICRFLYVHAACIKYPEKVYWKKVTNLQPIVKKVTVQNLHRYKV